MMRTGKLIVAIVIMLSLGSALGRQVSDWARGLGGSHHFTKNDVVYLEPSVTSTELVVFDKSGSNKILDRIKMDQATAVVMKEDVQLFDKENEIAIIYNNKDEELVAKVCNNLNTDDKLTSVLCYSNTINEELKYNEAGEVCVSSPTMMNGYLNHEDETNNLVIMKKIVRNPTFHSG